MDNWPSPTVSLVYCATVFVDWAGVDIDIVGCVIVDPDNVGCIIVDPDNVGCIIVDPDDVAVSL